MKINDQKTQLLCVSTAGNEYINSYTRIAGEKIELSNNLKICGYNFGSKPTVDAQIDSIEKKFNMRA